MGFPTVDRYADIIKAIIAGSYYENLGTVVPYRSGNTTFRLETSSANTAFGVYINEVYAGSVTSDVNGNVVLSRHLPRGEVELTLLDGSNGRSTIAYLSVRDYAIWQAAYADVLEDIDDNIIQVRNNAAIETAELTALIDVYGDPIGLYADIGQGLDAYRWQVNEMRQAYRDTGGRFRGLEEAVASFTQVTPFGYSRRKWGPNWVLDQSMLVNHRFVNRSHQVSYSAGSISGVTLTKVEPDVVSNPGTTHVLFWNHINRTLTWVPDGATGPAVTVVDGDLFLPGPPASTAAFVLGRDVLTTPYSIAATHNTIHLNIDEVGIVSIPIVTGLPNPTPLQIAGDINTYLSTLALAPDYAAVPAYASVASVYNGKLLIESPSTPGSVDIIPGPNTAGAEVFGVKPGDLKFQPNAMSGVTVYTLLGDESDLNPLAYLGHIHDETLTPAHYLGYSSPLGAFPALIPIPESGEYTLTDTIGHTARVHVWLDDLNTQTPGGAPLVEVESMSLQYGRVDRSLQETQGLWVNIVKDDLPAASGFVNVTVVDDVTDGYAESPDYWFIDPSASATSAFTPSRVITGRTDPFEPCRAFAWQVADPAITDLYLIGHVEKFPLINNTPRGRNFPQDGPGGFYDYEGFEAKFSGWFKGLQAGAINVQLAFSFDGGDNWVLGVSTPINADVGGFNYEDATYVEFSTVIPSDIKYRETPALTWEDSGVLVRAHFIKPGANMDVLIEGAAVSVKYITSRSLANATVARSRHRQYFGELLWLWAPEDLLLKEEKYIGLQHKDISPSALFGGVRVTVISSDTPAGIGTMEYEYNSVGNIRKLRWQPYGTSYAPGVGWVSVSSTGTYRLTAPDSSYIDVYVTHTSLPDLTGTMPVTSSKSLTVTDTSTDQGHTRNISPAHSTIDISNVTEYDSSSDPYNLMGAITETDFSFCGLVNCEIAKADPFKYSYIYPEFEPVTGETLTLAFNGATLEYDATLTYYSDEDQTSAVLYEDGLPVPNSMWSFTAANVISIPQAWFLSGDLDSSATFTLDYNLLYQVTTTVFDLGTTYQDYAWWADYYLWQRLDKEKDDYYTETPVYFNAANYRAALPNRSNQNKATSNLIVQEASGEREIPKNHWRFIDSATIEITAAYLVNGQYYLKHYEPRVYETSNLTIVFEHRSASTAGGVTAASWSTVSKNDSIEVRQSSGHRFHQLRMSVTGIRDLKDFKVRSLVLKGLNLHSSSPSVPGLTDLWTY